MKDHENTIIEPTPEELKMYEANQEDEGYKDILRILGIVPSSLSEEQKSGLSACLVAVGTASIGQMVYTIMTERPLTPPMVWGPQAMNDCKEGLEKVSGNIEYFINRHLENTLGN